MQEPQSNRRIKRPGSQDEIGLLLQQLKSPEAKHRERIVKQLAKMGAQDERVIAALVNIAARDPVRYVSEAAGAVLQNTGRSAPARQLPFTGPLVTKRKLVEDQATGKLTLREPFIPHLVLLPVVIWILGAALLVPSSPRLLVLLLFSPLIVIRWYSSLTWVTISLDPQSRMLTERKRFLFLRPSSTHLPFSQIEDIEVELYRTDGRGSHDAWRVNANAREGSVVELNSNGGPGEMLDFAQKIASLTGAPLHDHSQTKETSSLHDRFMGNPTSAEPSGTQSEEPKGFQLDEYLQRALGAAPTESQEAEAGSEVDAESAPQAEFPAANSTSVGKAQEPTPMEIPAPGTATAETDPKPVKADLRNRSQAELEHLVVGDPNDAAAHYALALKYQASGEHDRALELLRQAVALESANAEAQDDLGVALKESGRQTEAEAAYRHAIALDPSSYKAHLHLAVLLRATNREVEGSQEFLQAQDNARSDDERQAVASAGGYIP